MRYYFYCSLTAPTSCNGQKQKSLQADSVVTTFANPGDTVSETGKHIRFIFQDHQNNVWFASDGEGLFKFNGKMILRY
jgi:hypothetical protein